jgi:hypothetical protein
MKKLITFLLIVNCSKVFAQNIIPIAAPKIGTTNPAMVGLDFAPHIYITTTTSPNGDYIMAENSGEIKLWNIADGKIEYRFQRGYKNTNDWRLKGGFTRDGKYAFVRLAKAELTPKEANDELFVFDLLNRKECVDKDIIELLWYDIYETRIKDTEEDSIRLFIIQNNEVNQKFWKKRDDYKNSKKEYIVVKTVIPEGDKENYLIVYTQEYLGKEEFSEKNMQPYQYKELKAEVSKTGISWFRDVHIARFNKTNLKVEYLAKLVSAIELWSLTNLGSQTQKLFRFTYLPNINALLGIFKDKPIVMDLTGKYLWGMNELAPLRGSTFNAILPNNQLLLEKNSQSEPKKLMVVNAADGKILRQYDAPFENALVNFLLDKKQYIYSWLNTDRTHHIALFDMETGKMIRSFDYKNETLSYSAFAEKRNNDRLALDKQLEYEFNERIRQSHAKRDAT